MLLFSWFICLFTYILFYFFLFPNNKGRKTWRGERWNYNTINLSVYVVLLALVKIAPTPSRWLCMFASSPKPSSRKGLLHCNKLSSEKKLSLISPVVKSHVQGKRIIFGVDGNSALTMSSIIEVHREMDYFMQPYRILFSRFCGDPTVYYVLDMGWRGKW